MGIFDNILGDNPETKEKAGNALSFIAGKDEGRGMMYGLLTGFTNLIAQIGNLFVSDEKRAEKAEIRFDTKVEERMSKTLAATAVAELDKVTGGNKDLTAEEKAIADKAWQEAISEAEVLMKKYKEDGKYTTTEQNEYKNHMQEHFKNEFKNVRGIG